MTNNNEIQFTRYLYEKDEVKLALITSVLNKKEEAVFWAYELYYSGFVNELAELFLNMYYDFYASLNPSFEKYLHIKIKLLFDKEKEAEIEKEELLAVIVNNFMTRPFTCDVFFMRKFAKELVFVIPFVKEYQKKCDFTIIRSELKRLIEIEDYLTVSRIIFYEIYGVHLKYVLELIVDHFMLKGLVLKKKAILLDYDSKIQNDFEIEKRLVFSRLIHFASLSKKVKMGRNLYVRIEPEDVVMYETITVDLNEKGNGSKSAILPAYKILPIATMYEIDKDNYLSLFRLKRETMDITKAYLNHWLYHASLSPLWKKRIEQYHGKIIHSKKTVEFEDEDEEEIFYEHYGFEPDEQKKEIQNKTICPIVQRRTWYDFYLQHKNRGIIDIDKHYFDNIEKMVY
jgi:hypothetical protein